MVEHSSRFSYESAMLFWQVITRVFFREIRPRGAFNIPHDGPVIFVGAPHHNQFLDPLLLTLEVRKETHRRVGFLTAAKSMDRPLIGFFARIMDSIPVKRAADEAKSGSGHVYVTEDEPLTVRGVNTKFTEQIKPRMQIMLPKSVGNGLSEVAEVISDTEIKLKKEFGGEKNSARVFQKCKEARDGGKDGLTYKVLPHVDQQEMYSHVYESLREGGCIGIFPEGGSHDRTDLLPLKAGVSLMALGAMSNHPGLQVKIVPVGLSYFHPHRFRSRAVVEFGSSLDVPPEFVEMYKRGGADKREAVTKMLDLIYDSLKTVTVRAPDYDTLMLIQAVRRLYKTPGQNLTLGQVVELNRRFLEAYVHFKDEPRVQTLRAQILKYNRLVRDLGLRDHQVPRAKKASWKLLGLLAYRLFLLALWSVLALPGMVINAPMFVLASYISRIKAKEALAGSTVKIEGRDVLATWKILISLGVAPVIYSIYSGLATWKVYQTNLPLVYKVATPFAVSSAMPFIGYATLKFGEAGMDVLKSLRPLILALLPGQQRSLDKLKAMRLHLSNEVADLINDLGPQLYEDFDKFRILVPSASAPPSGGSPGLFNRKSSTGAVDAQGNLLSHPMTWIDERLFGWTTSSKRGTSVWAGRVQSDLSRSESPAGSDDEDDGDHGTVMRHWDEHHPAIPSARSRSFKDMQKLRKGATPLSPYSSIAKPASKKQA